MSLKSISFDEDAKRFSVEVERVFYEKGKKGKSLGFIPVIRYPKVKSILSISNVNAMNLEWFDKTFDDESYSHQLVEIVQEEDNVEIYSDYFKICLPVKASSELTLEDILEPIRKNTTTDIAKSIFKGMEDIDKLKA